MQADHDKIPQGKNASNADGDHTQTTFPETIKYFNTAVAETPKRFSLISSYDLVCNDCEKSFAKCVHQSIFGSHTTKQISLR